MKFSEYEGNGGGSISAPSVAFLESQQDRDR